jgi:hypothetical protein
MKEIIAASHKVRYTVEEDNTKSKLFPYLKHKWVSSEASISFDHTYRKTWHLNIFNEGVS